MSVKCQVIIDALERLAPRRLAEEWDSVGLQIGSPAQEIHGISIALDLNEQALAAAERAGANLIVCHHPLIFKPLKQIRTDRPEGRLVAQLLKRDIAVYVAHTNLDIAQGGVNDVLAARLGLTDVQGLAATGQETLCKIAVFVPQTHWQEVAAAMTKAGAGHIGKYSNCTFRAAGIGTFLPLAGSSPFVGEQGKLEEVEEVRLETVMPETLARRVVRAMLAAHPYEEAAYDLYALQNDGIRHALGRIGCLAQPLSATDFLAQVKEALQLDGLRVAGDCSKPVRKVALCGGSGASLIGKAAFAGADAYITGDVKYHEAQAAEQAGLLLIDAGHFATEWPVAEKLNGYLSECAALGRWGIEVGCAQQHDVFKWI